MSKEAMKLALDALEINNKAWKALADSGDAGFWEAEEQPFYELSVKAITALKALAEQPAQQEPFEYWNAVEGWVKIDEVRQHFDSVGCGTIYKTPGDGRVPLTTAQRKPLTLGQKQRLWSSVGDRPTLKDRVNAYGLAIEAAHGIKENT